MSNEELLRSAGLILTDEHTQQEGITLAAILLFGHDSTIMSVLPQHKTDAIFRVVNTDRYDDRDVVITNLLESYDRLLAFGQNHHDTFHLEGIQSVSARDHILLEIISNLLAHRDSSSVRFRISPKALNKNMLQDNKISKKCFHQNPVIP
jgi:ATP-dependent DNA helicase RecG